MTFPGSPPPATGPATARSSASTSPAARSRPCTRNRAPTATTAASRAERHRVRHRRRLLVHRSRRAARTAAATAPASTTRRPTVVDHRGRSSRVDAPNGIGLSPTGDRLYVAETHTGRGWAWDVPSPGSSQGANPLGPERRRPARRPAAATSYFDSLGVDGDGWVCIATLANGGITSISPDGAHGRAHAPPTIRSRRTSASADDDLRTAYITCSGSGRLLATEWPRPGLQLAYHA